jgi:hypothetical protein
LQTSVQPEEGHRLAGSALRLEIAVFVEEGFLLLIESTDHGPIDLASKERLGIEVALPSPDRASVG